jgi:hypothetical protein
VKFNFFLRSLSTWTWIVGEDAVVVGGVEVEKVEVWMTERAAGRILGVVCVERARAREMDRLPSVLAVAVLVSSGRTAVHMVLWSMLESEAGKEPGLQNFTE